jgi:hypothetical protein
MKTSDARPLRDPVLLVACALAVLGPLAFAVNLRSPVGPQILPTVSVTALYAVVTAATCQAWRACTPLAMAHTTN